MSAYVVLDGPDGCGKSSQAVALSAWLRERGCATLHVREPGSTPTGEALRQLLLSPTTNELQPVTEALLFSAARAELIANVVGPALSAGEVVIAERCYLSTIVYQGLAHAESASSQPLEIDWLFDLTRRVHGAHLPDAIFLLDVPTDVARMRRRARTADRIEARGDGYHGRVREAFLQAAKLEARAQVFDASRAFGHVQAQLRAAVARFLP
ncbi:MAG: dTMP kinase [Planctomycetota bacterium]